MSSPIGPHRLGLSEQSRFHGSDGRGPLGLHGEHREIADLIRRSELLAERGDQEALGRTAHQVVETLVRHIDDERSRSDGVEAAQHGRVVAGQAALLESATRFATQPAADAGANLLALLVRQADIEEAAGLDHKGPAVRFQFATDWTIASPVVASP